MENIVEINGKKHIIIDCSPDYQETRSKSEFRRKDNIISDKEEDILNDIIVVKTYYGVAEKGDMDLLRRQYYDLCQSYSALEIEKIEERVAEEFAMLKLTPTNIKTIAKSIHNREYIKVALPLYTKEDLEKLDDLWSKNSAN